MTPRRLELLHAIVRLTRELGRPPTASELARTLGMTQQGLNEHLSALRALGSLEPQVGHTPLALTEQGRQVAEPRFPVVGEIAAGLPIYAGQVHDTDVSTLPDLLGLRPGDLLLRVRGDSMTGMGIRDGDWVAYRPADTCDDGEIAVVLIPDEDRATLKYLFRSGPEVELRSANPQYAPLRYPAEAVQVQGCYVAHFGGLKARRR